MGEPSAAGAAAQVSPFNFKQAITQMVQRNGSDLLLKVGRPATVRVNGDLVALDTQPLKPEELKSLAEQIMTPRQVKEFAEHKEADFAIGVPGWGASGPTSISSGARWPSRSAPFPTK
jgi:Tfp pilus assembly ATPase PilU